MNQAIVVIQILLLFGLAYWHYRCQRSLLAFYWPALIVRMAATMLVGVLYHFYYGLGDTLNYYSDALALASIASTDPAQFLDLMTGSSGREGFLISDIRAFQFTKVIAIMMLLGVKNYWVLSLVLSFLCFLAAWHLIKRIAHHFPTTAPAALLAFLFFPSAVFWSSGLIRESLAIACLYYLVAVFVDGYFRVVPSRWQWPLIAGSIMLFWMMKYYYAAPFLALAIVALFYRLASGRPGLAMWCGALFVLLGLLAAFALLWLVPNFRPQYFFDVVADNYRVYVEMGKADIFYPALQPDSWGVVSSLPRALVTGFFRPFPWEAANMLQLVQSIENCALLVLTVVGLASFKRWQTKCTSVLVAIVLIYTVALATFIALSTPNFGTLSRYRVGYLPFYVYLLSCAPPMLTVLQRSISYLVR